MNFVNFQEYIFRRMKKNELLEKIGKLQSVISRDIKSINNGGCGIFALRTHRALNKIGIENKMIVQAKGVDLDDLKYTLGNLKESHFFDIENTSFNHCFIYIPSMEISFDANIVERGKDKKRFKGKENIGSYNDKEMKTCIKVGGWNPTYKRNQNRKLSRLIYSRIS